MRRLTSRPGSRRYQMLTSLLWVRMRSEGVASAQLCLDLGDQTIHQRLPFRFALLAVGRRHLIDPLERQFRLRELLAHVAKTLGSEHQTVDRQFVLRKPAQCRRNSFFSAGRGILFSHRWFC